VASNGATFNFCAENKCRDDNVTTENGVRVYDLDLNRICGNGGIVTITAELPNTPIIIRNVRINNWKVNASGDLTIVINEAAGCTIQRLEHVYTQYDSGGLSYPEGRTTIGPVLVSGSIGAVNSTGGLMADNIGLVRATGDVRGIISTTTRNFGSGNIRGLIDRIESTGGHIRATVGGVNSESIAGLSALNGTIGVPTGSFSSIAAVSSIGDIVAQSVRANIAVGSDSARSATAQLRKLQTTIGGGIVAHVPFNICHADLSALIPQGYEFQTKNPRAVVGVPGGQGDVLRAQGGWVDPREARRAALSCGGSDRRAACEDTVRLFVDPWSGPVLSGGAPCCESRLLG